jgi:uncharacterized membrane protein YdjX (TVP38/TMEM64 family)
MRNISWRRQSYRWLWLTLILASAAMLVLWRPGWSEADVGNLLKAGREYLVSRPAWLFAALVVLNGLPFPSSLLFVLAGAVWGEQPITACGYGLAALALNHAWTYWLAAGPAHQGVGRAIRRFGWTIPMLKTQHVTDTILVIRLLPGIPLFVQNYLLGLLRVPYWRYAWMSLLCNGPYVVGFILAGAGIADGRWKTALAGIGVVMLALVAARLVRRKWRDR